MCGIFGIISKFPVNKKDLNALVDHSQQRGKDSSGLMLFKDDAYLIYRSDFALTRLVGEVKPHSNSMVVGHSRLVTNGVFDNQPVVKGDVCVLHNGIIVNHEKIWDQINENRELQIDTEIIAAIASAYIEGGDDVERLPDKILGLCVGVVACAIAIPTLGKLCLFSNNGSLYVGTKDQSILFSSEEFPLNKIGCRDVRQVKDPVFVAIPVSGQPIEISDNVKRRTELRGTPIYLNKNTLGLLLYSPKSQQVCFFQSQ